MFWVEKGTYPVDLVETVHVQLPDETRELFKGQRKNGVTEVDEKVVYKPERALTLLCLKWDPRIVLLNSATLETTKLVPSSVQLINWADFGSMIILGRGAQNLGQRPERKTTYW